MCARKLLVHSFIFANIRQRVSTMSSRCSHSAVNAPNPIHLHFHITTSGPPPVLHTPLLTHPETLFFHLSDFFPFTFLYAVLTRSFISNLHPPTPIHPHVPLPPLHLNWLLVMQDAAVISEHHHYNKHFRNVKTFQLQKQIVLIINFHYMQGCRLGNGTT